MRKPRAQAYLISQKAACKCCNPHQPISNRFFSFYFFQTEESWIWFATLICCMLRYQWSRPKWKRKEMMRVTLTPVCVCIKFRGNKKGGSSAFEWELKWAQTRIRFTMICCRFFPSLGQFIDVKRVQWRDGFFCHGKKGEITGLSGIIQ